MGPPKLGPRNGSSLYGASYRIFDDQKNGASCQKTNVGSHGTTLLSRWNGMVYGKIGTRTARKNWIQGHFFVFLDIFGHNSHGFGRDS